MSNKNMSNVTSSWILFVGLLFSCLLSFSASEDLQITGRPGSNVLLQCQGTKDVKLLKWSKPDLQSDYYVYLFRNEQSEFKYQHPSFHGRVELRDPGMKNGDVTLTLKNIRINDTGTYECYVGYGGRPELISTITLTVADSGGDKDAGNKNGHVGLAVGLPVGAVLLVVVGIIGFVIYRKHKGLSSY